MEAMGPAGWTAPGSPPPESPRSLGEALPVFLGYASPRILIVALAIAIGVRGALADWSPWDLAPVLGILAWWPFQEWLIHVTILHARPVSVCGRTLDFRVPREHRAHHRDPWKLSLLFIPVTSYLYSLPLLVGLWFLVTPTAPLAWSGIAAHLALTLHYEWVHFLVHTRVQPRTAVYGRLWRNHRLHHFKNEGYWFGVTRLSGDRLLGTAAAACDVPSSPTVRTLGIEVEAGESAEGT